MQSKPKFSEGDLVFIDGYSRNIIFKVKTCSGYPTGDWWNYPGDWWNYHLVCVFGNVPDYKTRVRCAETLMSFVDPSRNEDCCFLADNELDEIKANSFEAGAENERKKIRERVKLCKDIPEAAIHRIFYRESTEIQKWKPYISAVMMRPYIVGEDLSGISVSNCDFPREGGMIAQNTNHPRVMWYVARKHFEKNYKPGE